MISLSFLLIFPYSWRWSSCWSAKIICPLKLRIWWSLNVRWLNDRRFYLRSIEEILRSFDHLDLNWKRVTIEWSKKFFDHSITWICTGNVLRSNDRRIYLRSIEEILRSFGHLDLHWKRVTTEGLKKKHSVGEFLTFGRLFLTFDGFQKTFDRSGQNRRSARSSAGKRNQGP